MLVVYDSTGKQALSWRLILCMLHSSQLRRLRLQIVYYDGQFDDSRLCVALACTAALAGAAITNHTEATKLLKVPLNSD